MINKKDLKIVPTTTIKTILKNIIKTFKLENLSIEDKYNLVNEKYNLEVLFSYERYAHYYGIGDDVLNLYNEIYKFLDLYYYGEYDKSKILDNYKATRYHLYEQIEFLKLVLKTLDTEENDFNIFLVLYSKYQTRGEFLKDFLRVKKGYKNDPRLKKYTYLFEKINKLENIYLQYEQDDDKFLKYQRRKEMIELLEMKKYLDNYLYMEFVVKNYISNIKSMTTICFLKTLNIDIKTLEYSVEGIKVLNPTLYQEYLNVKHENIKIRNEHNIEIINELNDNILKGNMTVSEFLKNIPFKNSKNGFIETLSYFLNKNLNEDIKNNILTYIHENNLEKINYLKGDMDKHNDNIDSLLHQKIINYMKNNKYPLCFQIYNDILNRFLEGLIDLDDIKEEKQKIIKPIVIPYSKISQDEKVNILYK